MCLLVWHKMTCKMTCDNVSYPPFLGDLALSLQLGPGLSTLQDAVVLFGIDIQRFLLKHLRPRQGDTLHCGNCTTSRHHLTEGETQTGTQCSEPLAWEAYMYISTTQTRSYCANTDVFCHSSWIDSTGWQWVEFTLFPVILGIIWDHQISWANKNQKGVSCPALTSAVEVREILIKHCL